MEDAPDFVLRCSGDRAATYDRPGSAHSNARPCLQASAAPVAAQDVTARRDGSTGTNIPRARMMMIGIVSIWLAGVAFGVTSANGPPRPKPLESDLAQRPPKYQTRVNRVRCSAGDIAVIDHLRDLIGCVPSSPGSILAKDRN